MTVTKAESIQLSEVLKKYRWATNKGLREMAREIGTSAATLSRIERGGMPDGRTLAKVLQWLLTSHEIATFGPRNEGLEPGDHRS